MIQEHHDRSMIMIQEMELILDSAASFTEMIGMNLNVESDNKSGTYSVSSKFSITSIHPSGSIRRATLHPRTANSGNGRMWMMSRRG